MTKDTRTRPRGGPADGLRTGSCPGVRRLLIFLPALGAGALLLAGCGTEEEAEAAPVARPVSTLVVGEGFEGRLTFPGTVQAAERAELSFRVPGPLIELPAEEGDEVRAGQLLARIDPRDYRIAATEARAAFEQAEAEARRYQRLYEREAVPLSDLEVRLARRDVARARLEQAEANLRDTGLRAPFAGQVGRRYVENFEDVQAREPILSLHDFSTVEVVVNLPESVMASVREGEERAIAVIFEPLPDRPFPARVTEFAVAADPQTQTFPVTVSLPQPEQLNVLPGMTATVVVSGTISARGEQIPISVPASAVFSDEAGRPHVWVVVDGDQLTVESRPVRVGPVTGRDQIVVLGGLEAGDRVVTAGVHDLRPDHPIRLMER